MTIAGVTNTGSNMTNGISKASGELGRDDFLNLLVTQLQYQDPLNPMDSTDFTAQLAQFSSLEQLTNMNEQLEALATAQSSLNNTQAVAYIGHSVLTKGSGTQVADGRGELLHVSLEAPAAKVFVSIYDVSGALRSTFTTDAMAAGRGTIAWDGTDMDSNPLPNGNYRFEVAAVDAAGEEIGVSPMNSGLVSGVAFQDGVAKLVVNGQFIPLGSVVEVIQEETGDAS